MHKMQNMIEQLL